MAYMRDYDDYSSASSSDYGHRRGGFFGRYGRDRGRSIYTRSSRQWLAGYLIALCIVLILHVVGFATPEWYVEETKATPTTKRYSGLWETCTKATGQSRDCTKVDTDNIQDWWEAAEALECIGLVFLTIGCILTGAMLFLDTRVNLKYYTIVVLGIAGVFIIVGGIVYLVEYDDAFNEAGNQTTLNLDVGYSGILCIVAGVVAAIIALIMTITVHVTRRPRRRQKRYLPPPPPAPMPPPPPPMPMMPAQPAMMPMYATMPAAYGTYGGFPAYTVAAAPNSYMTDVGAYPY